MAALIEAKRPPILDRKLVPLKRLKDASHNPTDRIATKKLRALIDSMDLIGLLHPILIRPDHTIIDGHRRVAAARKLGWRDIEANITTAPADEIYASVNLTARRMSGNELLSVWLVNVNAVMPTVAGKFRELEDHVGRPLVKKAARLGHSLTLWRFCKEISRYIVNQDYAQIFEWLIEHRCGEIARQAIRANEPPAVIAKAIAQNKPLRFALTAD